MGPGPIDYKIFFMKMIQLAVAIVAQSAERSFNFIAVFPLYKHDIAIKITNGTYEIEKITCGIII